MHSDRHASPDTGSSLLPSYATHSAMTSPGRHEAMFEQLPPSVPEMARIVPGVLLHEYAAGQYDVKISEERMAEKHIRPVEEMLDLLAIEGGPLSEARPPGRRLAGVCRHFTVMLVAMLRSAGVPARARCGFGSYFHSGSYEDHWVTEYWKPEDLRWVRVDAQLDGVWRAMLQPDFDPMDVPLDRFIVAGDAWAACRDGASNPLQYGIFDMRGLWFVAGNLVRDLAALNQREMLPWDSWGPMPSADAAMTAEQLALFDTIARATGSSASTGEAVALYEGDSRLRVPSRVFNVLRDRLETVWNPPARTHGRI